MKREILKKVGRFAIQKSVSVLESVLLGDLIKQIVLNFECFRGAFTPLNFTAEINCIRTPIFNGIHPANTAFAFSLVIRVAKYDLNHLF